MYVRELISNMYAEVFPTELVNNALQKINEFHLHQLPLVENGVFLGLILENDLLEAEHDGLMVNEIHKTAPFVYIYDHQHVYEALQMMTVYDYDILPVVNQDHQYLGIITAKNLLAAINATIANVDQGSIIVLEMDSKDYAMAHISHIIESENAHIFNISSRSIPDTNKIEMTIKLNKTNIAHIVASLRRHDYIVTATFNDGSDHTDIQERYHLLMNYLDI